MLSSSIAFIGRKANNLFTRRVATRQEYQCNCYLIRPQLAPEGFSDSPITRTRHEFCMLSISSAFTAERRTNRSLGEWQARQGYFQILCDHGSRNISSEQLAVQLAENWLRARSPIRLLMTVGGVLCLSWLYVAASLMKSYFNIVSWVPSSYYRVRHLHKIQKSPWKRRTVETTGEGNDA